MYIDLHPKKCNLCGGEVIYTSNAKIYNGKEYGSGFCYLCTKCGAYVGTHRPYPDKALGLLANDRMRKGKIACHSIFDKKWKGKQRAQKKRTELYWWLSKKLDIDVSCCHFGYFDIEMLKKAYRILKTIENEEIKYDRHGNMYIFEEELCNTTLIQK